MDVPLTQADPRDPHPCGTCGVELRYDGWDSVHVEGPLTGMGEMECEYRAKGIDT